MPSLKVQGQAQLGRVAKLLEEKGNSASLKRRISKTLRAEADPITRDQRASLAAGLPKRGGASATITPATKMTVRVSTARATVILVDGWRGHSMRAIDRGTLRHPLFGNRKRWYDTTIPSGLLSKPFARRRLLVQFAMLRDLDRLAEEIAREV